MTWSGNMKKEVRKGNRPSAKRQRFNSSSSSSSSRGTPSPKHCDERVSPIHSSDFALRIPRFSPTSRETFTTLSRSPSPQGNAYAGAKFSEPPSPELLPKPPSHWMNSEPLLEPVTCNNMSSHIKMLLNVPAH